MPANAMGTVTVSFNPVSTMGGDTLVDVGSMLASPLPRFVASNNTQSVIDISICTTTLLFPFVTNQLRFDTGLVITNTSQESGSCTIEFSGSNSPDDEFTSQPVAGEAQWVKLLPQVVASGFQGYITATCGFRDGYGFAFVSNGYPGGPSTLAQGYLAVVHGGGSLRLGRPSSRSGSSREEIALRTRLKTIGESGPRSGSPISLSALNFLIAAPGRRHAEGFNTDISRRPTPPNAVQGSRR